MLLKKIMIKEICEESGFTDDSYVVIDIPSIKEKMNLKNKFSGCTESETAGMDAITSLIKDIHCQPIDDADLVIDWDTLSCYSIATKMIEWIGELIGNGYVPKKI